MLSNNNSFGGGSPTSSTYQPSLPAIPAASATGGAGQTATTNNNNTNTNNTHRSKFAGMPGSASALHVHFGFKNTAPAFDPLPADHPSVVAKREAKHWAQGTRLGQKPDWDCTSGTTDAGGHPRRALMHQLSEFQAPKIVYNFRAQQVPSVHKQAVPVWKSNKFKIDQTAFLTKKEKSISTHHVLGNTNALSHAEMPLTENPQLQRKECSWNTSTALAHERDSLFVKRKEVDFRALNRVKRILDQDRYVNPIEDVRRSIDTKRDEKRQLREAQQEYIAKMKREARARRGLKPASLGDDSIGGSSQTRSSNNNIHHDGQQTFKMSNIDTWWDASPPEVQEAVMTIQSRRQAEEERAKKADEEANAAGRMQQPSSLRVVAPDGGNSSGPVSGR